MARMGCDKFLPLSRFVCNYFTDEEIEFSMVDTVLYTEKLTPQRLERILLDGLHPNIRLTQMRRGTMSKESLEARADIRYQECLRLVVHPRQG